MRKVHLLPGLGLLLLLLLATLGCREGRSAPEPAYHGRTVTEWLDTMAVYEEVRNWDQDPRHSLHPQHTPEELAADPALQALLAMGPTAVPALRSHLNEPPTVPSRWRQIVYWVQVTWGRLWDSSVSPYSPMGPYYSSRGDARSLSAGLALVALGTNRGGGLAVLMEEQAKATLSTNQHLRDFSFRSVIDTALTGLPERRSEIREAIDRALAHPDPFYRQFAAGNALARRFPEAYPQWRPVLIRLAGSEQENAKVREAAMLALHARTPVEDAEFVGLCLQMLTNRANSSLLRARAINGLRFGGSTNADFLSRVQSATNDVDTYVRQFARSSLREAARPRH